MKVRVHYPLGAGELVLRSDRDWERDLAPLRVDRARRRFEFELDDREPYHYFKPVLVEGNERRWARGENALVLREPRGSLDVYPHFAEDSSCHVCTVFQVPSSYEVRGYDARVFLPPGYDENPLQRFPVLYMQDGQNLFFPDEADYGKHWRVSETLTLLDGMCLVRPVIVVGIYPRDRRREYTRPGYEDYGRFVARELKPMIDAGYRTLSGPADTAVMGSSLGGVVSFYLGWEYPEVFGQVGALSAAFGFADDLLARVLTEKKRALRIYLDSGWPHDNYEVTRSMAAALRRRGLREGQDFLYLAHPDGRHEEDSWARRCHLPFQFFFRR